MSQPATSTDLVRTACAAFGRGGEIVRFWGMYDTEASAKARD